MSRPPAEVKARRSWRERRAINVARRAAQQSAVEITVRIPRPPLPGDEFPEGDARRNDPERWRPLLTSLPGYDPYALGAGYYFEPDAARDAIEWIENNVSHLEGAKAGQNFILEPWQRAVIANLLGWLRNGTDLRRYRECLIYVAKKAGKSALVMALTLYLFAQDEEPGAKVYCAAAAQKQARIIWDACKLQLSRIDPGEVIAQRFQHSIVKPDGGFLKPIARDIKTEDGFNPSAFICDELHRQPDAKLVNAARLSSKTRAQPMIVFLTTADEDRESVCNDYWVRAKQVRDNRGDPSRPGHDPRFLPVIYEAEASDNFASPVTWKKANPNLGVTIPEEEYAAEWALAKENPALMADFLRYCLNLRVRSVQKAFNLAKWDGQKEPFDEKILLGAECVAGLDLSSTTDITALVLYFLSGHILPFFWVPREASKKRDLANDPFYARWSQMPGPLGRPMLTLTEGDQLDEERVLSDMLDIIGKFKTLEVAVDPANSLRYTQPLMKLGVKVVAVRQGWYTLNEPLKWISTQMGTPKMRHGGHPVLRWMIGNAEVEKDAKDNWSLVKPRGADKIDGVSALATALARVLILPSQPGASVYETRGVLEFGEGDDAPDEDDGDED